MKRRIRLLAGGLAALGLAAGLAIGGTGTAHASVVPPSATWSEIFSPYLHAQANTLCFDDPSGSTARDQPMQLWRCHGYASNGAPQRWAIIPVLDADDLPIRDWTNPYDPGSPLYYVYNLAANECLTGSTDLALAQQLTLGTCTGPGRQWELSSDNAISSSGWDFQLYLWTPMNPSFRNCASASNFTDSNGTRLVIGQCSPYDTSQIWNLG
jgi:hypothetical protein